MRRQGGTGLGTRRSPAGEHGVIGDTGNALAEFALVLPLLMMFVFGIVELGFAFTSAQAVEAAAREGGRLASLSSATTADVQNRVEATLAGTPLETGPQVTITPTTCAGREGQSVSVTVSGTRQVSIPFVIERNVVLSSEAVFRCEA